MEERALSRSPCVLVEGLVDGGEQSERRFERILAGPDVNIDVARCQYPRYRGSAAVPDLHAGKLLADPPLVDGERRSSLVGELVRRRKLQARHASKSKRPTRPSSARP